MLTSLVIFLGGIANANAMEQKPSEPRQELIEAVISAYDANYTPIENATFVLEQQSARPWVMKEQMPLAKDQAQKDAILKAFPPKDSHKFNVKIWKDTVLIANTNSQNYDLYQGNVQTQYSPDLKLAWKRKKDGASPGLSPDPREIGVEEWGKGLTNILKEYQILKTENSTDKSGNDIINITMTYPPGGKVEMRFDSSKGLLPTVAIYYDKKGYISLEYIMDYVRLESTNTWFLKSATRHIYDTRLKNKTKFDEIAEARETNFVNIMDLKMNDQQFSEDLTAQALPVGTEVRDGIARRHYEIKLESSTISTNQLVYGVIMVACVVIAIMVVRARRVSKTSKIA